MKVALAVVAIIAVIIVVTSLAHVILLGAAGLAIFGLGYGTKAMVGGQRQLKR